MTSISETEILEQMRLWVALDLSQFLCLSPKSKLQGLSGGNEVHLDPPRLVFDGIVPNTSQILRVYTELEGVPEEDNLHLDECTASVEHEFLVLKLELVFHPVYTVPSLYVALSDKNGQLVENTKQVLQGLNTELEHAPWTIDEHPASGAPAWTCHICELPGKIRAMQSGNHDKRLYLLQVMSVLGPLVGLSLTPLAFQQAAAALGAEGSGSSVFVRANVK
jgi:hypothetical protein